jgi:hypothetical protein
MSTWQNLQGGREEVGKEAGPQDQVPTTGRRKDQTRRTVWPFELQMSEILWAGKWKEYRAQLPTAMLLTARCGHLAYP